MPWPRQQEQRLMVNGTMSWPQQDPQQQQPQQQLISYDSDGEWVRGASTAVPVYLHRWATGVTVVDNNGTSVVTAR